MECQESSSSEASGPQSRNLPASAGEWLRFFWSGVLFPGGPVSETSPRLVSLALLLLLPGLLLYPCLKFTLFDPDEGRYAEIPREMLVRGDWVVPYLQGQPYLDKPPLVYWLGMLSYKLFGVADWSARLPTALAVHGCILSLYLLGRRSLGERPAFWGALLLGLAPGFMSMGRLLVLDGVLTFFVVLALLSALEAVSDGALRWRWWWLAAVACGFGALTKGPVALVLVIPPLVSYRWLMGYPRLGWRAWSALAGVVVAINLPWYAAICWRLPHFAGYFFWQHNVLRFLSPFDHLEPIWFYVPILLLGFPPLIFFGVGFGRHLASGQAATAQERRPELGYFLLAAVWCVLFFSMSGCKLATYVLPAFPPLALAFGTYLASSRWQGSRWPALAAGLAFLLMMTNHHVGLPWFARQRGAMGRPREIVRYFQDQSVPVVCFPRGCDSVAFYTQRDDFRSFRGKETLALIQELQSRPRTLLLFTHRHSLDGLRAFLPPHLCLADVTTLKRQSRLSKQVAWLAPLERLLGDTPLGLSHVAVVENCLP